MALEIAGSKEIVLGLKFVSSIIYRRNHRGQLHVPW